MSGPVPTASGADSLKAFSQMMLPVVARGAIVRRPPVVKVAEKLDADRRAIRRMQELAATYGRGPVLFLAPYRDLAVVLDPDDVRRILIGSPEPFATANAEKRSALAYFQPPWGAHLARAGAHGSSPVPTTRCSATTFPSIRGPVSCCPRRGQPRWGKWLPRPRPR